MSKHHKPSFLIFSILILSIALSFFQTNLSFAQSDLVIQNYQLVSKTRVGRTAYDYVFKANIKNNGTENVADVTAVLTSLASTTSVIDGSLTFGEVSAGATITSSDTFTVRIDRLYTFDESKLKWEISFKSAFFEEYPAWNMPSSSVVELIVEPDRANPGDQITINAIVSNKGTGVVKSLTLIFLVDDVEIGRTPVSMIFPAEEKRLTSTWTAEGPGRHIVRAQIELGTQEFDPDSFDNFLTSIIHISGEDSPKPDVEFTNIDFDSLNLIPGNYYLLPLKVRNPSFAQINNIPYTFLIDGEIVQIATAEGGFVQYLGYLSLEPGKEKELQVPWNNVSPGQHTISIWMDLNDKFVDYEYQRTRTWSVTIPDKTVLYSTLEKDKWVSIGPSILDTKSVGRMNAIAFHPTNPNIIYASSSAGGIWKTTDGGESWMPLGDNIVKAKDWRVKAFEEGGIGGIAIAIDPQHPEIVYFATGDSGDENGGSSGIYKSLDGGKNWDRFASNTAPSGETIRGISKIEVRYSCDRKQMFFFAATNVGLLRYKSGDPWEKYSSSGVWDTIKNGVVLDFNISPLESSDCLAGLKFIFVSVDKEGLSWNLNAETAIIDRVGSGWMRIYEPVPIQIDPAPTPTKNDSTGTGYTFDIDWYRSIMYVAILKPQYGPTNETIGIYRGDHLGLNGWVGVHLTTQATGLYNPFLRVSYTSGSEGMIYFGGVRLYKVSTNFTSKIVQINGLHADMKRLEFDPYDKNRYYVLDDGGIWRCTKSTATASDNCVHRNNGLRVTQFYDFDTSKTNPNLMIGGTQDNSTILFEGMSVWREFTNICNKEENFCYGDGYYSLISPFNDQVMYAQQQRLMDTARSTDGGKTWQMANKGLPKGGATGGGYITAHQLYPNELLAQGDRGYVTLDGGDNWFSLGVAEGDPAFRGYVTRLVVQNSNPFYTFAGTNTGQIWYGPTERQWDQLSSHPDGAMVRSMAFAPSNYKVLYVAFKGGQAYNRIWRFVLLDGYPFWSAENITENFPSDKTIKVIAGDGYNDEIAYVGTEEGVYRWVGSEAKYKSWKPYSTGLPMANVSDLLVDPTSKELRAATNGRGAWRVITGP